jgi:hypothetical protein
MFNLANVICVKLRSNSGKKLLDNQLECISIENDISLSFLKDMRAKNYFKIYFEKRLEKGLTNIVLIAYADSGYITFLEKYKKIPDILKAQIKIMETVKIPKETAKPQRKKEKPEQTQKSKTKISKEEKSKSTFKQENKDVEKFKKITSKNNIVKINLTKFNYIKLKEISEEYYVDYESIVNNKKAGYAILWIDNDAQIIIAYTKKKDNTIHYTQSMDDYLFSLQEVEVIKEPKELSLDAILEKISKYGVQSLTDEEKGYLDELSKE